ncbi:MAG: tetratricopeptide repeat protein, partial [Nostoc sp.]
MAHKAEAAKTSVINYGESLFNQVFQADINAYSHYRQLRLNLNQVKIEIVGNELDAATREALQEGFKNHYIGLARDYNRYMESKEPQERQIGIFFCRLEYENLYNALQICLEKQESIDIFFCLFQYFYINNDIPSSLKLSEFVCQAQVAYPPEIRTGEIGMHIVMALDRLAMGYLQTQNYPQARASYLRILELSQQLQGVEVRQIKSFLASIYHQLGRVAQKLREYDQARDYYQQALEIRIEFG